MDLSVFSALSLDFSVFWPFSLFSSSPAGPARRKDVQTRSTNSQTVTDNDSTGLRSMCHHREGFLISDYHIEEKVEVINVQPRSTYN